MCSPIGHNNTKHFLYPIRSRHLLEFLETVRWESVPRGSFARNENSRPDWLPLGLRGWYMTWVGSSCCWGGWGAPCCKVLKVMTHFTLSCNGVWVRVVCIQLSRELTNTAELNLLWHRQQQTLYHLLGFWVVHAPTLRLNVEFCSLQLLILKMSD